MSTQAKLGNSLLTSLISLREKKGELKIEDVGEMFSHIASTLQAESATDRFLKNEIDKLAGFIAQARQEMAALTPEGESEKVTGDASLHLDEIVRATEEASHTIMDAADVIQNAAAGMGGEKEQQIADAVMRIYEACNFQDLTGQRIGKVVTLINGIEERIGAMLALFGAEGAPQGTKPRLVETPREAEEQAGLLGGPQLSSNAPTQADIDALFDSFKP